MTGARIAVLTGVSSATVSRVLERPGLSLPSAEASVRHAAQVAARNARHGEAGKRKGASGTARKTV